MARIPARTKSAPAASRPPGSATPRQRPAATAACSRWSVAAHSRCVMPSSVTAVSNGALAPAISSTRHVAKPGRSPAAGPAGRIPAGLPS